MKTRSNLWIHVEGADAHEGGRVVIQVERRSPRLGKAFPFRFAHWCRQATIGEGPPYTADEAAFRDTAGKGEGKENHQVNPSRKSSSRNLSSQHTRRHNRLWGAGYVERTEMIFVVTAFPLSYRPPLRTCHVYSSTTATCCCCAAAAL